MSTDCPVMETYDELGALWLMPTHVIIFSVIKSYGSSVINYS